MKKSEDLAQLFLRLILSVGLFVSVMDRLGVLGSSSTHVNWGNWRTFIAYTQSLLPYLEREAIRVCAVTVTMVEVILAFGLLLGYKIPFMAIGTSMMTFIFAICMAITYGIDTPFNSPVLIFTWCGIVLSGLCPCNWSIDNYLLIKKSKIKIYRTTPRIAKTDRC